ncbi:MAG: hypothetical protein LVQ64_03440 [Thermoplasmatales archaeon]|nr:hypothetical protein [Thermoplasmatales archaeon]
MHPEDPHLRVVQDRRSEDAAEGTEARDRERGTGELLAGELPFAAPLGKGLDLARQLLDALGIGVVDDGHEESVRSRYGDSDAEGTVKEQFLVLVVHRRVETRLLA